VLLGDVEDDLVCLICVDGEMDVRAGALCRRLELVDVLLEVVLYTRLGGFERDP
jgi:hypothetical protein